MKLHAKRNGGFTLPEVLLTAAILIILLALSSVEVVKYRDELKITELDNAARDIYMAAQNRAVLLKNSLRLDTLLLASGTGGGVEQLPAGTTATGAGSKTCFYIKNPGGAGLSELLPEGSVDPALRGGEFYIVYEPDSGSVTDVFYVEKGKLPDIGESFKLAQESDSRKARMKNKPMLGWYGGGMAAEIETRPLPTPGVEVLIENGNELLLTVKYTIPEGLPSGVTYSPSVKLEYQGETAQLLSVNAITGEPDAVNGGRLVKNGSFTSPTAGNLVEYTWTVDALEDGKHFKELFSKPENIAFGGDFTVTASLKLSADGYLDSSYYAGDADNSLFDTTSTDDTAYIANLRHLQNLDSDSSGAAGKENAVQCADIDCGNYTGNNGGMLIAGYEFKPIQNNDLRSYDARYHDKSIADSCPYTISNLTVTAGSANKKNGAGLFGSVGDAGFKFQGVRLVDAKVTTESTSSGALLGYFWSRVEFDSCQVIGAEISTSGVAGGMAGFNWDESNSGNVSFNNCTVEKLRVNSSNSYAGGLLGGRDINNDKATGNAAVSFTDCTAKEIQVTGLNYTGGLTGTVNSATSFKRCQVIDAGVKSTGWQVTAGGIAGYSATADISFVNCRVKALTVGVEIERKSYAGGMLGGKGKNGNATFTGCGVGTDGQFIAISGYNAGGILGNADEGSTARFSACTVGIKTGKKVAVTGVNYAGGLVGNSGAGSLDSIEIFNADITATGDSSEAGGLAGKTMKTGFKDCTATGVTVKAGNSAGGLVGNVTGGEFNNCKAVNAEAASSTPWISEAGGLAGRINGTNLTKCWVYWENTAGMTASDYKITAATAGGLVGSLKGGGTITESLAATLINATTYAGGLVGYLPEDANVVEIAKSYADCYLCAGETGVGWATTGGLIGLKENAAPTLMLENVYSTGVIKGKNYVAAGLCGGWYMSQTTIRNAYAAMHYDDTHTHCLPLANDIWPNNSMNCYFLEPSEHWLATKYGDMQNINLGGAFAPTAGSYPYNLDGAMRSAYPFPGLAGLPHYGDWPTS